MAGPGFWKTVSSDGLGGLKKPQKWPINELLVKIVSIQMEVFLFKTKVPMSFNFFQKQYVWEKSGSWVTVQKPLVQLECRISQTAISHK